MTIIELKSRTEIQQNKKLENKYILLNNLILELKSRELGDNTVRFINEEVVLLNAINEPNQLLGKQIKKSQSKILKLLEQDYKLVPKNYYRKKWLAIGMAAFGIPFGAAFGAGLGNMSYIGVGIAVGIALGAGLGTKKDQEAFEKGNQLNFEI